MEVAASPEDLELIAELAAEAMDGAENMDEALHNAAHGAAIAAAFSNLSSCANGNPQEGNAAFDDAVNIGRAVAERVRAIYANAARQLPLQFPPRAKQGIH